MKFWTLLPLLWLNAACNAQKISGEEKALQLTTVMPLHDPEFNLFEFKRTITLVERNDISIFKIPTLHQTVENRPDGNGDYISELINVDTFYYYVMYKNGQKYGFTSDSAKGITWRKISVDSFLTSSTIYSLDSFVSKIGQYDSLISTFTSEDGAVLNERYIAVSKPDSTYCDTTILTYNNNLNNYRFSFSVQADNKKKKKLCYLEMVYNARPDAQYLFLRERRALVFEIREVELSDPGYFDNLANIYKELEKSTDRL